MRWRPCVNAIVSCCCSSTSTGCLTKPLGKGSALPPVRSSRGFIEPAGCCAHNYSGRNFEISVLLRNPYTHLAEMNTYTDEKWLHPDRWQRVVDGELDSAELAELVEACEQRPELWKRCAVAFLEEQTLGLELRGLAGRWPATPAEVPAPQRPLLKRELSRRAQPLAAAHSPWLNRVAFAASIALAFLVGWQASVRFGRGAAPMSANHPAEQTGFIGNSSLATRNAPAASASQHASNNPVARIDESLPADSHPIEAATTANSAEAIEWAFERPEQFVPLNQRIPKPLADLEQRGWVHIESIEGFVPVRLQDGKTAVVPVQQIDLRPVRKAY